MPFLASRVFDGASAFRITRPEYEPKSADKNDHRAQRHPHPVLYLFRKA
jgi:hypothetical protein